MANLSQLAPVSTAVATTTEPRKTIGALLAEHKKSITSVLPKHLTPERLMRVALTTINKNPKLAQCTPESLLSCIIDSAMVGLEPDSVMGRAYLVPYWNNKLGANICTFQIGYKGLAELAYRSGQVKTISAHVVYDNDFFEYAFGLEPVLKHRPAFDERGKPKVVYCVVNLKDGAFSYDVMSVEDVERIRKRSKSKDDGPWNTDWDEMAKKTVFKRLSKYLPLSAEFQQAVAKDNAYEFNPDDAPPKPIWDESNVVDAEVSDPEESKEEPKKATARLTPKAAKAGTAENRGHGQDGLNALVGQKEERNDMFD